MDLPLYLNDIDSDDLKTRLLAPFAPRYRVLRQLRAEPRDMRMPLRDLVMTPDRKFLFLRNAKAGCTSIAQILYYYATGEFFPRSIHRAQKGVLLSRYHWADIKPVLASGQPCLFTFVRDPEARAYSAFTNFFVDQKNIARHNHMPAMTALGFDPGKGDSRNFDIYLDYLEACLEADALRTSTHFRPQVMNICFGKLAYDFIGKLENIAEDLPRVFEMGGAPGFPPSEVMNARFNPSKAKRPPRLSPPQRARIRKIFEADYQAFGYD
ncbi:sulfotransferase family protein [Actibacterium sp. XHP0104]|uniref:sulfotransferase family protein n=1 Tax=Actibacterium sp. XHP0104 TaxID=2984335 RepID=UPI0021E922EA|nr:sulfotransferase family protein [Actibacterium sp. XHP0104]MCV2881016.1 sulfotransferase family protein [Actibacterium sp. XHP0104]